ncbi:Peptidyl-prolyl cis-trans isomerase [Perkinsus chesapeaki]|uniref:peptidylprolyl isomerase n=1 Tax=Perkinsus chesapeaki TaxID=330153 RepID=A0A7J6MTK7_PERCH|nr:Peptidyl-prolyl cis-trans isomerase [Perkinsus chesapeaki]
MFILRGIIAVFSLALLAFCEEEEQQQGDVAPKPRPDLDPDASLRIGVKRRPETPCDKPAGTGDEVSVHYTGWLRSTAHKFDSSRDRKEPFKLTLGQGMVIKGWDLGIIGMCPGELRRLTIPSNLGYGSFGSGEKIPGNATLVFDVELIAINGKGVGGSVVEDEEDEDDNDPLFDDDSTEPEHNKNVDPDIVEVEEEDDL